MADYIRRIQNRLAVSAWGVITALEWLYNVMSRTTDKQEAHCLVCSRECSSLLGHVKKQINLNLKSKSFNNCKNQIFRFK